MNKFERLRAARGPNPTESRGDQDDSSNCGPLARLFDIPLGWIVPDESQPSKAFDDEVLRQLGASMRHRGQLHPAHVRYDRLADRYVLIAGERRWRAAQLAGLRTLQCVVDNTVSEAKISQEPVLAADTSIAEPKPLEPAAPSKPFKLRKSRSTRAGNVADTFSATIRLENGGQVTVILRRPTATTPEIIDALQRAVALLAQGTDQNRAA
ncbi:MAG: ParB N-terminal domain-containing protein [Pirellulales bacterium]